VLNGGVRLTTLAPAKVNLVLRVGPLRPDGYHDIDSLFVPLDLADRVDVRIAARAGPVTCRVPGRPELDGPGNLGARAAEAFRVRFGVDRAIDVTIEKRVPITAGLGGGSSDAAAVLRCLALGCGIRDRAALAEVGLSVGSDVPFFLFGGAAWGAGRGERLVSARVPALDLVLLYPRDPALAIRAGDAYRWLDAARQGREPRWPLRRRPFSLTQVGNDLEPGCVDHHPSLRPLMGRLGGLGAAKVIMSGSGPTIFGIFRARRAAADAARAIESKEGVAADVQVLVARTRAAHPRVTPWRSPRSGSSQSTRRSSRRT
jgi:4-diphosphocytidyl-2-C-methyl-D-erythritol kinase